MYLWKALPGTVRVEIQKNTSTKVYFVEKRFSLTLVHIFSHISSWDDSDSVRYQNMLSNGIHLLCNDYLQWPALICLHVIQEKVKMSWWNTKHYAMINEEN